MKTEHPMTLAWWEGRAGGTRWVRAATLGIALAGLGAILHPDRGVPLAARQAKVRQDLLALARSISLHDAREPKALTGGDLRPLLGRYHCEIPLDPWGRDYLFDAELGVLASLGADGFPGGRGADEDLALLLRVAPRPGDPLFHDEVTRALVGLEPVSRHPGWMHH